MNRLFVILLTLLALNGWTLGISTQLCSFTAASGSALTSYSVGGESAFTRNTGAGAAGMAVISNANRYRANGTSGSIDYINNYTPSSADYGMEADVVFLTFPNSNSFQIGPGVRCGTGASFTGYYSLVESRTGGTTVRLAIYRAGNGAALGLPLTITQPAANASYRIRIMVQGGSTPTIYWGYRDNAAAANVKYTMGAPITPAGADIVTQTGVPGVYSAGVASFVSDTTGFHMDNLMVNDALTLITLTTSNAWDNGEAGTGASSRPHWTPYSSLHLLTDATAITVTGLTTIQANYPLFAQLYARVDDVNQAAMTFTANSTSTSFDITPSGTTSTYELINGGQAKPSGTVLETYMTSALVFGYTTLTTQTQPTAISRTFALVDSVSSGANSTNPGYRGYLQQLRNTKKGTVQSLVVDGWGSKGFFSEVPDAAGETTLVARIAAYPGPLPTTLLMLQGGNDYLLNLQTAAAYQTRMSGFVGKFHTQFPGANIVIVGFIHLYAGEGNNAGGDNAAAYRTADAAVAAANPTFCTYLDMSAYPVTATLTDTDNIHPLSGGHDIIYHEFVEALGFKTVVIGTSSTNFNSAKTTVFRP